MIQSEELLLAKVHLITTMYINIWVYSLSVFILLNIFFLFDVNNFKSIADINYCSSLNLICFMLILLLSNLAGIPPFLGFSTKLLIILNFFFSNSWIHILLFSIFNLFGLYFYLNNVKFLYTSESNTQFLIQNNLVYLSRTILYFSLISSFFIITSYFFIIDLYLFFFKKVSYLFLN